MTSKQTQQQLPDQFKMMLSRPTRTTRARTVEAIEIVLGTASVSMTVSEITEGVTRLTGRANDTAWIRSTIHAMREAGLVSSRRETDQERLLRGNGRPSRGTNAELWSLGKQVPARTVVQAIDGIVLDSSGNYGQGKPRGRRGKGKKNTRPAKQMAKAVTVQTPGLLGDFATLTDEIRTLNATLRVPTALTARVERLEAKLNAIAAIITR
jgi:hypothetical protein